MFILIEPEDSYRYSRLKNLINSNKGKTQITFAIKNKDEKKLQTINNGIKLNKKFFEDLVELMGVGKIKFEMWNKIGCCKLMNKIKNSSLLAKFFNDKKSRIRCKFTKLTSFKHSEISEFAANSLFFIVKKFI